MTKQFIIICSCIGLAFTACKKNNPDTQPQQGCVSSQQLNSDFLPAATVTGILNNYTASGLPGITFIAKKGDRYWQFNSGKTSLENNKAMEPCMLWPAYSITKMYTATCILKLKEKGRLSLDQKISTCLPPQIVAQVPDADRISVRMLLNHSSGIENFWENPAFVGSYIQDPSQAFDVSDYLDASQERLFEPGKDVAYSNTNYLLLALIIDRITGKDHAEAYRQFIWQPLNQTGNFYKDLPAVKQHELPQLYADVDGSGSLINYTMLSLVQFRNESGSNSIMTTPKNFVDFMDALVQHKILSATTTTEMKTWFSGTGNDAYGLGLELFELNGRQLYGHSGSSFGGRTLLLHDPQTGISFFIGVNAGDEIGGPVLEKISNLMNEVLSAMTT